MQGDGVQLVPLRADHQILRFEKARVVVAVELGVPVLLRVIPAKDSNARSRSRVRSLSERFHLFSAIVTIGG